MAEADKEKLAKEVLKRLNSAVITTKLYPPTSSQVLAVEKEAFAFLTSFLQKYGKLGICLDEDDIPRLCGLPLLEKKLGKIPGQEIFQHLRVVGLNYFVLQGEIALDLFRQIVVFFTTSPQMILKRGGDGRNFVTNLGLGTFFPAQYTPDVPDMWEDSFASLLQKLFDERSLRSADVQSLVSRIDEDTDPGRKRLDIFVALKAEESDFITLVAGSCAFLLKGPCRLGQVAFPPAFSLLFQNLDKVIVRNERNPLSSALARFLLQNVDDFALHLLLLQKFSTSSFARQFYTFLLASLGGRFDAVLDLMIAERTYYAENIGVTSPLYLDVSAAIEAILATERGRQYLRKADAQKQLEEGEQQRHVKRVQLGIEALLRGDEAPLKNGEVLEQLPLTVASLLSRGKNQIAARFVESILRRFANAASDDRLFLAPCLTRLGETLLNAGKWGWLEKFATPLMLSVKEAEKADDSLARAVALLVALQKHMWAEGNDEMGDKILTFLHFLRNGRFAKEEEVSLLVAKELDASADRALLGELLENYLQDKNAASAKRLLLHVPVSARYLLQILLAADDTATRLAVLELLQQMGRSLAPILLLKLQEAMPWYAKRNLLNLLAGCGSEKDIPSVIDYLNHEDIRVQMAAFSCIRGLSGDNIKQNYLEALSLAVGRMKEQVVRALIPMADGEVAEEVVRVGNDWRLFADDIRESLLFQIFNLLAQVDSRKGQEFLQSFLEVDEKKDGRLISQEVRNAAQKALRQMRLRKQNLVAAAAATGGAVASYNAEQNHASEAVTGGCITDLEGEKAVRARLLAEEDENARMMLVDLIEVAVAGQRYDDAGKLRDWLVELDPSDIQNIFRATEILQRGKDDMVSDDFLHIWPELNETLSTEEFNAFYSALETFTCQREDIIVRQGDARPALYFINSGSVKMFTKENDFDILTAGYSCRDVFGVDAFFAKQPWPGTVASLENTEISLLPLQKVEHWVEDFPALFTKLEAFCRERTHIPLTDVKEILQAVQNGISLRGEVSVKLIEADGRDSGVRIGGDLLDAGRDGLTFLYKVSQIKNARVLLGRPVCVKVHIAALNAPLDLTGSVTWFRSLFAENHGYPIHVCFEELLSEQVMQALVDVCQLEDDRCV